MEVKIEKISVTLPRKISEIMELLSNSDKGIVLVIDENKKLLGTITDGDIRRGLLRGLSIGDSIELIMNRSPIMAPISMEPANRRELMRMNQIRHLPLISKSNQLVSMEWQSVGSENGDERLSALIMAGGEGIRLRPLTEKIPKPMLKVGGKPLLEINIELLKKYGFKRIILNIRYLKEVIVDHFKDGKKFGIDIHYIEEMHPMGTAGSIGLIPPHIRPSAPFLVLNGDLLTTLNFKVLWDFHRAANYDFTLCGRPYEVKIPFGYPVVDGDLVKDFREKPSFTHLVNSGVYCLSPELIRYIPENEYFDMPDLIRCVIEKGKRVGVFPLREKFHEIGRIDSFETAEHFYKENFG